MPSNTVRHPSARRVDAALESHGLTDRVRELPDSTRTASDAARALGCEVRQIVKSLVFRREPSGTPVLALVAGDHRLDEPWMHRQTGERWTRADPEWARSVAGFAIGGVPPIGHPEAIPTYVDYDLLEQREVWAAAGHPNAVCRITSPELLRVTRGRPISVVPLNPSHAAPGGWVSFDCYGTIVDWRRGILDEVVKLFDPSDETERARIFTEYLQEERTLEEGPYQSYREIMSEAIRRVSQRRGRPLTPEEAGRLPESLPTWPVFPDSKRGLDRIRQQGRRIAILSNIDRDLLDRTISENALPVDLSITAQEVRSYKPAFAHWIRLLKETGMSPEHGLHVAGSFGHDIEPAAALGFPTVYVDRYGPLPPGAQAGSTIRSMDDIPLSSGWVDGDRAPGISPPRVPSRES